MDEVFMKRHFLALSSAALAVFGPAAVSVAQDRPVTEKATFLEFLNAPAGDEPLVDVPRLAIGAGGDLHAAVVDTGSTGVVLSASSIADVDRLPSLGKASLTYSSSGRIMMGRWVVTRLTIAGRNATVTTDPIPVLAVERIDCTPNARRCTPMAHPASVAMLGIGFAREYDHQPDGTPDHNPLLHLVGIASQAYMLTRRGVRLGASSEGFTLLHLQRDAAHGDWASAQACIRLNDLKPACGNLLVDTGITGMFMTLPPEHLPLSLTDPTHLRDGTSVAIDLVPATGQDAALGYAFKLGEGGEDTAPSSLILAGIGRRATFVNTGVHLLNRFDYLYDAGAGVVGFRQDRAR
jgi:predicted aspartyl protease